MPVRPVRNPNASRLGPSCLTLLALVALLLQASGRSTTAATLPLAPTALSASVVGGASVTLNWTDNATDETGYVVEHKTGSAGFVQVGGTLAANAISFTDTTVAANTSYTYQVKAINASSSSAYSNQATATTPKPPYRRTEEDSALISWLGAWTYYFDSRLSGGQTKHSAETSAKASFNWSGGDVSVIMVKGPMMGKALIVVDGVASTVDLYASSLQFKQVVFVKENLAPGPHSLSVEVVAEKNSASSGFRVALDAFDVR